MVMLLPGLREILLILAGLVPLFFACKREPKALLAECFFIVFLAISTFLSLFGRVSGLAIDYPGSLGNLVAVICMFCGFLYLLEVLVLFFLTPRLETIRAVLFALSIGFFSAVLVCGFTSFSALVVVLHVAAVLGVTAWCVWANSAGLIVALLFESMLFGYGFIAPFLKESEVLRKEFLPMYSRFASGLLILQFLVARDIAPRYRAVLTAGAALVPVYYCFFLFKMQQFGSYESLIAAVYGSCLMLVAQWTQAPLLAFVGCVSVLVSLAAALYYYLNVEMTVAALTSFSILFGGLTFIGTLLYFGMILMHQRRTFGGYALLKRAVGGGVLILLFLTIRMYGIFAAHYYALFTHLRSAMSSILSFFKAHDATQVIDSTIYRTWFLIGYDALWGLLLTLGGKAYQRLFVEAFGLVLLSVALYKLSLIVSHRGVLAIVLLVWFLVVATLYRSFRRR